MKSLLFSSIKFCSIYLDFAASYLPALGVFNSSLSIFNVVVQDKGHSFHSIQDNLCKGRKIKSHRVKKKTMVFYLAGGGGCKQTYLDNVTITAEMTSEELLSCV